MATELLHRLGAVVGGRIAIGKAIFRIRAALDREPDRAGNGRIFGLGPRVMISEDALPATGLILPGSVAIAGTERDVARLLLPFIPGAALEDLVAHLQRTAAALIPVAVMPLVALGHEDEAAALEPTHYDWQLRRMRPLVEEIGPERSRRQAQEAATPALE